MTSSTQIQRHRGAPETVEASNRVVVIAPPDECGDVEYALRFSRFVAVRDAAGPGLVEPLAAVLVSDRVDGYLEICRAWVVHCPVLLVSVQRDFAFRLAAARAGVTAVVDRPIDSVDVAHSLQSAVGGGPGRVSVVLVDDDVLASALNAEILRSSDVDVVVVNDPTDVLDTVERLLPDLILMDLNMPGVDGIELAQVIRLTPRLVAIPILFLSGERDKELQQKALRLGGDDFLLKPIDSRKLIADVRIRGARAKALRSVIERDSLTGLLDRGRFHERLRSISDMRCRFSLVLLDIDRFKTINDTYGHDIGDRVIQTLAQLLISELRQTDIIGRCGGEEFGAILLDIEKGTACRVMDRIRERFAATVFEAGSVRFTVSFSAGIASTVDPIPSADLFKAADQALYGAKRGGRNQLREAVAA